MHCTWTACSCATGQHCPFRGCDPPCGSELEVLETKNSVRGTETSAGGAVCALTFRDALNPRWGMLVWQIHSIADLSRAWRCGRAECSIPYGSWPNSLKTRDYSAI